MSYDNGGGQYISGHSHDRRGGGSRNSGNGGSDYDDVKHCRNFADCGGYVYYKYSWKNEPNYCDDCKERFKGERSHRGSRGRSGDLYDSSMGNVHGGNAIFNTDGSTKQTVYGDNARVSWTTNRDGSIRHGDPHMTDQNVRKKSRRRHP